ncbi:General secretion pathway protein D [sediment metagenome]|uniref:General secretion pathway protein D n=1 Tax=sediment metagenome TaxID=749907 RepID=D9PI00_9ZZZZ
MRDKAMMRSTLWIVAALLFCCAALAAPSSPSAAEEVKEVALDFDDVDIRLFIRVISELTGKNFTIDNNVRGKVTVLSPRKLTTQQAYDVFKSVLNVNGFTVVESGPVTKIVPAQNMSGYELPLSTSKVLRGEDQFITQIMPLRHLDANALIPADQTPAFETGRRFLPPLPRISWSSRTTKATSGRSTSSWTKSTWTLPMPPWKGWSSSTPPRRW